MTVKRTVQLNFVILAALAVVMGLVLVLQSNKMRAAVERGAITSGIVKTVFDLTVLYNDYLEEPRDRIPEQWQMMNGALGALLRRAEAAHAFRPKILAQLNRNSDAVRSIFAQMVVLDERVQDSGPAPLSSEQRKALCAVISTKLYLLAGDASALQQVHEARILSAQRVSSLVIVLFVGVTFVIMTANYFLVRYSVLEPLASLIQDTRIIGGGNLDHVVTRKRSDEIGDLARAFNQMTSDLNRTYEQLREEIALRKQAEALLMEHRDHLAELVSERTRELTEANENLQQEISLRKDKENELLRSNQDLEQFAYVASHDLQEPLRNVSSCMQLLERGYRDKLGPDADQLIRYAVDSAVRMKTLVNDLLVFSRVGTKGTPFLATDCEEVLTHTLWTLGPQISESGALITHDPLPTVQADATQLSSVLQNLLHNAMKFRREESPRIHVSAEKHGSEWVFSVADNGIGIEARHFDRIFVIFQRLHHRAQYEGTGMGLAIAKKIVERHRGRMWVESKFQVGSTFSFTLPAEETR
jgi:signal transduction histidine kinase